ncbi:uncharacterized protein TRIADDRAFT_62913 [Trichoplax adhaerens]|uniref:Uncharacterized protein n=1 Tax=Trichoplax adhaerens TaxID=10228 RepID=B3SFB2_TRIAD|nr:predicted protein [Trichoplax adhaerens]EDV18583.1 predicted protein [Trichoplax adhaerens]|eukprot:XP_002118931.1 predicted protein [Trichoplax adhaerens]
MKMKYQDKFLPLTALTLTAARNGGKAHILFKTGSRQVSTSNCNYNHQIRTNPQDTISLFANGISEGEQAEHYLRLATFICSFSRPDPEKFQAENEILLYLEDRLTQTNV